jgi:hypothetical protein
MTGRAESSNREWVHAYQRAALPERLHGYRPAHVLAPPPRVSQGTFWTVRDLPIAVEVWYGVVDQATAAWPAWFTCVGSASCGPNGCTRPDRVQDPAEGVIGALDQRRAWRQASLTRGWSPVGHTPYVGGTPRRAGIHFFSPWRSCVDRTWPCPCPARC